MAGFVLLARKRIGDSLIRGREAKNNFTFFQFDNLRFFVVVGSED
jgi:hypothetical protein